MSRENVELVYQGSEAFNRRDIDAFLALFDPDVEFISRFIELEGGEPYRGRDGIRSWWQKVSGVWRDLSLEIEEVRDLGEVTVTRVRLRGHGMESNAPWEQRQWHVMEWRRGKVTRWRIFMGKAEALEAAGLREQAARLTVPLGCAKTLRDTDRAMAQANVEIVRRAIDAGNRRDRPELLRLYSPQAEIDWSRSRGPLRGVYRGRAEFQTFSNEFYSAFEDVQTVAHDFTPIGSDVVVSNTAYLRGRDGIEVIARSTFVYTVEDGQITRLRMFQERAEALEAAGLEE